MKDCQFGVSPVNYSDSASDSDCEKGVLMRKQVQNEIPYQRVSTKNANCLDCFRRWSTEGWGRGVARSDSSYSSNAPLSHFFHSQLFLINSGKNNKTNHRCQFGPPFHTEILDPAKRKGGLGPLTNYLHGGVAVSKERK